MRGRAKKDAANLFAMGVLWRYASNRTRIVRFPIAQHHINAYGLTQQLWRDALALGT